jgi:hypothetical protein
MLRAQLAAQLGDPDRALADLRAVATEVTEAGAMDLSAEAWRLVADLALVERTTVDRAGPPGHVGPKRARGVRATEQGRRRKGPRRAGGHGTTD